MKNSNTYKKLLAFSKEMPKAINFKNPIPTLNSFLEEELCNDKFQEVYDTILEIRKESETAYGKLFSYFYFHYC